MAGMNFRAIVFSLILGIGTLSMLKGSNEMDTLPHT